MNNFRCFVAAGCLVAVSLTAHGALPEFIELVKNVSPAVVNINTTRTVPSRRDQFDENQVPEFFRRFLPRGQVPRPATGSGFIISSDGYILTNNHVVEGADEIIVALSDRRERVAKLVGADPLSDLALLKIEEKDLPVVDIGSSKSLEVGEWVVAIGSPFGFELSVTQGIVSAKGRSLPERRGNNYVPFIQTDVAINPGNSGGPLLNLEGEVVGINSQIFTRSGGYMGLSFAIPIDVAMEVVAQLKEKGSVSRGWLGVLIQPVDHDLAESFGLDRPSGALVTQVFDGSPAESADLRVGDIILEFNGKQIDLSSDLPHIVGRTRADTRASLLIVRDGKKKKMSVKIGVLEQDNFEELTQNDIGAAGNRLGIDVQELSDDDRDQPGLDKGVLVVRVAQGPGRTAGIEPGDVITTIDSQWVNSSQEFEALVRELDVNVAIPVRIVRDQRPEFLVIKILP
jgi:serine protease Do